MPHRDGSLKAREFLFFAEEQAMEALPRDFPRPERRVMWTILQLYWKDPAVHFELQPQLSRGLVELGLHFEGAAEANDAWAAHIGAHAEHVLCELGPRWELEEWTASWRRLHRTFAFTRLDAALGREVGEELARGLVALQPLVAIGPALLPGPRRRA